MSLQIDFMRNTLLLLFILFSKSIFACTCVQIWNDEELFKRTELIFIGTVVKIDTIKTVPGFFVKQYLLTEDSTDFYTYGQFVTFKVKRVVKGHLSIDTIIIKTGVGGGDCGYLFRKSKNYIVHTNKKESYYIDEASPRKKLLKNTFFETDDCERTNTEIKKELKFLRKFLVKYSKINSA